jgi:hypothetical protein
MLAPPRAPLVIRDVKRALRHRLETQRKRAERRLAVQLVERSETATRIGVRKSKVRSAGLRGQWRGGAGGGTRTHKGFRPTDSDSVAFTGFATPAPNQRRTTEAQEPRRRDVVSIADRAAMITPLSEGPITTLMRFGSNECEGIGKEVWVEKGLPACPERQHSVCKGPPERRSRMIASPRYSCMKWKCSRAAAGALADRMPRRKPRCGSVSIGRDPGRSRLGP